MKKKIIYLVIAILIFLTGIFIFIQNQNKNHKSIYLKEITYTEFKNLLNENETFVLYIGNENCYACSIYLPKLISVIEEYKVEIKYLDTNKLSGEENIEFQQDAYITGTPTTIFIKDGKETSTLNRMDGDQSKSFIITKLKDNGYID